MEQNRAVVDVMVIGAGMAGLGAARLLAAQGFSVLVLEAQARIGGRILTLQAGREIIELGAEFVHGRPLGLLALIEEAGLRSIERTGCFVHHRDGELTANDNEDEEAKSQFSLLEQLEKPLNADLSFTEFLDSKEVAGAKEISKGKREDAIGFVEGFNAADAGVISAQALGLQQKAEDAIEGDRSFHVEGGYDQLPKFLAKKLEEHGGEIRLDTRIDRIAWRPGNVTAQSNRGSFTARRTIIAIPLGVLQRGVPAFEPGLPQRVRDIFHRDGPIRVGTALRFTMIFRERFWTELLPQPAMRELSFLISRETVPSVWWTAHPEASNALTGWIGGPRTAALAELSAEEMAERGCEELAKIFDVGTDYVHGLMTGCFAHDWSADPHTRGAYSYIAKNGLDAPGVLGEPVFDTLYFAGEHTATDGHWGTVHAALDSGLRAAGRIVAAASME